MDESSVSIGLTVKKKKKQIDRDGPDIYLDNEKRNILLDLIEWDNERRRIPNKYFHRTNKLVLFKYLLENLFIRWNN